MAVCAHGLRLQMIALPALCFSVLSTAYFQSTAKGHISLLISILRQVLVIASVYTLPLFWQLDGVWLAWPAADFLMVGVSAIMLAADRRAHRMIIAPEQA